MIENADREKIFKEIHEERKLQDAQWGGAETDDKRSTVDWIRFILYQMSNNKPTAYRERFIKIAALSIAAVESIDRINEKFFRMRKSK